MRPTIAILAAVLAGTAAAEPAVIAEGVAFPEGPVVVDGALLFAEYGAHKVSRWEDGTLSVFWEDDGCGPSAVVPMAGGYAVTCYDSGEMVVISEAGETVARHAADADGGALVGPNDATPDGRGGIYFTTSGPWESAPIVGRVLHLSAEGEVTTLADDLHYANGIALSADGARLLVAESEAGRVISFAVGEDGALSDRRLFVRLTDLGEAPGAYPDGLKLGEDGTLHIGLFSAGRVLSVSPEGALVGTLEVPSPSAPNLAIAPDGTVYVMAVDDPATPPYPGKVYAVTAD